MQYNHSQRSPLHLLLHGVGVLMVISAWAAREEAGAVIVLTCSATFLFIAGLSFGYLNVRDELQFLAIRFGPLPLFGTRVPYSAITAVEPSRSSWIDGWGIHYLPWRGWIYNLWGFDCVKITAGNKVIRIGSDDLDNLLAFLSGRLESQRVPFAAR